MPDPTRSLAVIPTVPAVQSALRAAAALGAWLSVLGPAIAAPDPCAGEPKHHDSFRRPRPEKGGAGSTPRGPDSRQSPQGYPEAIRAKFAR